MALKMLLVFVVCAVFAASMAEAQMVRANLTAIQGIVSCTTNISLNGLLNPPPFPNAEMLLVCNNMTQLQASTRTDRSGYFVMSPAVLQNFTRSFLVTNCTVMVNTSLAACNASLPAVERLVSRLVPVASLPFNVFQLLVAAVFSLTT